MGLRRVVRRAEPEARAATSVGFPSLSWRAWQEIFNINGTNFLSESGRGAAGMLHYCGPAFAVLDRRVSVVGEVRFTFQSFEAGKPTRMFSNAQLGILERPWAGGSTRQLLAAMELDVAVYGNSYWVREDDALVRLDPEWVNIVTEEVQGVPVEPGRPAVLGERLVGYVVQKPGGGVAALRPEEVAHYRPAPSPESQWRGESWLAAVATDAASDVELTKYKHSFLRNGAMPSIAVTYEPTVDPAQLEEFVGMFSAKFVGSLNAGKVMHLLGGRDVKTVGATLEDLAFKAVQGAGETRIAAAAGVPAVVAGFSEGMQGSSLNAGNYVATRRLFADAKVRPLLGAMCDALGSVVRVPSGSRLWYDDSQVSFFQEDVADEANIRSTHAQTIRTLIEAGYQADAAVAAVTTGNFAALVGAHSGLTSVQLQPPTDGESPAPQPTQEGDDDATN
jgi:hypothetical protein